MREIVVNKKHIIQVGHTMRNTTIVKRRSFEMRESGSDLEERVSVDAKSKGRERTTLRETKRGMEWNRINSIKEVSLLEEERRFKEPEKSRRNFEIFQLGQENRAIDSWESRANVQLNHHQTFFTDSCSIDAVRDESRDLFTSI
jgi:hypothetical protein